MHVADRESDSFELMSRALDAGASFVFRARNTHRAVETEETRGSVRDVADAQTSILTREVELSSRRAKSAPKSSHPERNARMATLHCSATAVDLGRPNYLPSKEFPPSIPVNLVRVWEPQPPEGQVPVEWLLYTTESIDSAEAVANVVDMYRARWLIEECNKALKTGCLYENRQFESRSALLTMLALSLPVACEILALRTAARTVPARPATDASCRESSTPERAHRLRRDDVRCRAWRSQEVQRSSWMAHPKTRHEKALRLRNRMEGCTRSGA